MKVCFNKNMDLRIVVFSKRVFDPLKCIGLFFMLIFLEIHQFEAQSKHLPGTAPIMKERPSIIVITSLSNQL